MKTRLITLILASLFIISLAGCYDANNTSSSGAASGTSSAVSVSETANTTSAGSSAVITVDKAKEIALSHAGLSESDITFINANLDMDDGRQIYEVEFYSSATEYDYDIDAVSGEIISYDHDVENYTPSTAPASSGNYIGEDKAKSIALERVPGATESDIQLHLDYDDGKAVYEGAIIYDKVKYEFEIDAASGMITGWEAESVFDD